MSLFRPSRSFLVRIGFAMALMGLAVSESSAASDGCLDAARLEAAQQVWNDKMLAGTFAYIVDRTTKYIATDPYEEADGWIFTAWSTNRGITVSTRREGIQADCGEWLLEGGLLRQVEVGDAILELYGKTIRWRWPGITLLPLHLHVGGGSWNHGHEFFLLRRIAPAARPRILQKRVVPDAHGDADCAGSLLPRAFLEYDGASGAVVVKVMNGHHAGLFIERVDISGMLGR